MFLRLVLASRATCNNGWVRRCASLLGATRETSTTWTSLPSSTERSAVSTDTSFRRSAGAVFKPDGIWHLKRGHFLVDLRLLCACLIFSVWMDRWFFYFYSLSLLFCLQLSVVFFTFFILSRPDYRFDFFRAQNFSAHFDFHFLFRSDGNAVRTSYCEILPIFKRETASTWDVNYSWCHNFCSICVIWPFFAWRLNKIEQDSLGKRSVPQLILLQ